MGSFEEEESNDTKRRSFVANVLRIHEGGWKRGQGIALRTFIISPSVCYSRVPVG